MAFLRLWALAAVVLLLTYAPSAIAHNWMHTPSRARRAATTVKGCMQRKATDTHAQIGPGQRMSLKWATGHPRRKTYWVIMPGAYEFKLAMPAPDLVKLLDDYLDNRPVVILQMTFLDWTAAMDRIFIPAYCFAVPRQARAREAASGDMPTSRP